MLQRSMGPVSLLVANAMSMLVRIAFTGSYIRKRFRQKQVEGGIKLLSKTYLLVRFQAYE